MGLGAAFCACEKVLRTTAAQTVSNLLFIAFLLKAYEHYPTAGARTHIFFDVFWVGSICVRTSPIEGTQSDCGVAFEGDMNRRKYR
jgi:hypothetical protein